MDLRAILLGLAFSAMWSSAFTSARIIVADAPPLAALSLRFLISGALAVLVARAMGQSWHLQRSQWRATVIFGLCQNTLYLGLNFTAMQTIEASLAVIIASTMPLTVALIGGLFLGERIGRLGLLGLLTGLAGVLIIMGARLQGGGAADPGGIGLCVLGMLALSIATLSVRGASSGGNLVMVVGLQMLVGSAGLAVASALTETLTVNWTWPLAAAFLYTLLVPGLAATLVWFWLVNRIGALRAATFHFLNPFLGVATAAAVLGERLGLREIAGVLVITLGILAVQLSKQRPGPADQR